MRLYTFTATDSSAMMLTIPMVIFGLFRYLQLVHGPTARGQEPGRTLLAEVPLLLTIAVSGIMAFVILARMTPPDSQCSVARRTS